MLSFSWAWLPAIVIVGTAVLAIPYLAFPILLCLLALPFFLIWGGEFLTHDPADEIRRTRRHRFFGPGGPDDPFANDPYDD